MLHDALAAAAFQQGSVLDWDPDAYRQKTGGGVPRVLHQVFMDGEAEYDRYIDCCDNSCGHCLIDPGGNAVPCSVAGSWKIADLALLS